MSNNAISESSNTHYRQGDFLNNATTTTTTTTELIVGSVKVVPAIERNACAISEQYPLANKMRETDCDSATPALLQQLNLARRACWCNNANNQTSDRPKRCENCCSAAMQMGAKAAAFELEHDGDSVDEALAADDYVDVDNGRDADNDVTTVLNGATFSKNITIISNKFDEANYDDENDADAERIADGDDEQVESSSYLSSNNRSEKTLATNYLSKSSKCYAKTKSNTIIATTTTITATKTNTTATNEMPVSLARNANEMPAERDMRGAQACSFRFYVLVRAAISRFWFAFVAFCDAVTIKHDDPCFAETRHKRQQQQQQHQQQQQQQRPFKSETSDGGKSSNDKPKSTAAQFRLLTNKKFILLCVVCLFASFLNRIEGRPNVIVPASGPVGTATDATTTGGVTTGERLDNIVPAKLSVAANSNNDDVSSALPPKSNTVESPQPLPEDKKSTERHDNILVTTYDLPSDHHKVERYPLSQVDFGRVKTPFIIGIWILSASIAKIGFHMTPKLHLIFPESCLLIVVGVVIGVVLYFGTEVAVSPLTPNTFFFYMLPPIILDAGYFMPNRMFFDNLGTILLMAVVGTIFNIATIGGGLWACGLAGMYGDSAPKFLDTFLFASLISAVDPVAVLAVFEEIHVNEILYIVVFGESLLNDAVTVVMYHMMEVYNEIGISNIIAQDIVSGVGSFFVVALGGTAIGVIWGVLTGLVTRFTDHVRVIEPIFIFVMAYLAYLNAEIFHMSGILSITFCGITMKNYVESNISQKSHTTVKYALKMLSSSSETIIFMFLGVATVNNSHVWNTAFVVLTITFCSVFRVLGVILLSGMANRFRLHKLSRVDQFVMSYGGLRGAVAFALVLLIDEHVVKDKNMFVTTTIAVIYFTVFVQGITIKPLVKILNVKRASKRKPTMNERIHERFMDHLMAGIEDIVGKTGNYNVRDKFKRFDNRFIRPLLIRDLKGAEPKIIETYSKLTMRDAMEVMRRNPSTIGQITATESMSALFRNYTNNCIGGRWAPPTIYTTCPSLTNLDNSCSRNLDMHELDYNPSKKDLTDAKIHHLLAEELKPYRRHRRLSYSRHAVDDRDLSTQVNYKMQMNFRRMFNDRKHHKRSKRGANKQQDGVKQNHVSFHDFQQNGTTKQLTHEENQPKLNEVTVVGPNDDWEEGLTFTAKSSLAENPIPEEDRNVARDSDGERRVATPTALESQLPWKRQGDEISDAVQQNEFPAWASNKEYLAYNSPSATFLGGINKPKQPKSVIGLFRRESSASKGSSTIGGVDALDMLGAGPARGSDPALAAALGSMIVPSTLQQQYPNPRLDKRSQSISAASPSIGVSDGHAGPFAVTASHRRNVRRGSMLELSGDIIPEESYQHGHSKSLCEPAGDEWESAALASSQDRASSTSAGSGGREPLLPRLTPRAQIRRMGSSTGASCKNQVTTALLSTSNSEYDDDDEDEDFDLYDDENIVVTTTTLGGNNVRGERNGAGGSAGGSNSANTTTTIRLTHNNDESII